MGSTSTSTEVIADLPFYGSNETHSLTYLFTAAMRRILLPHCLSSVETVGAIELQPVLNVKSYKWNGSL